MNKFINTVLLLVFALVALGQNNYWQQQVEYRINAQLDTASNQLIAKCGIEYTNNSPDTLDRIYIHLWANAFSNQSTAFADQAIQLGETDFYFADEKDRGGYVDIKAELPAEEGKLEIQYIEGQNEIAYISIERGLPPGGMMPMVFYYTLDIPKCFSRLGKTKNLYNMVAWYPKPAVYDHSGWHTFPYLSMGEFYSEFANYDVTLSVPLDYRVAHSGREVKRYTNNDKLLIDTRLDNAHDYAWFTSANFEVEEEVVGLKNGQQVAVKVFRKADSPMWSDAMDMTKDILVYLAEYMGDYPYAALSIVQGEGNGLGGAMEYPSIKIIDDTRDAKTLEYYIAHEVAHSWFYAAIGSNERDESYFDEGLTTFLEQCYIKSKYNGSNFYDLEFGKLLTSRDMPTLRHFAEGQICRHMQQALTTPVQELSAINYGLNAYQIGSTLMAHIESLIGGEKFKEVLQSFYSKWKFKHPSYDDLIQHIESETGLDLKGYNEIMNGEAVDMTIEKVEGTSITLGNNGKAQFEVPLLLTYEDGSEEKINVSPNQNGTTVEKNKKIKRAILDPEFTSLDIDPDNNRYPKPKLGLEILPRWDRASKKETYLMPLAGYNSYDGMMLGLSMFNSTFPAKDFKWNITPLFGLRSKSLVGQSWISYDTRPKAKSIRKIQYRLGLKSFSIANNNESNINLRYLRIDPAIILHHYHSPASRRYSTSSLRQLWIQQEITNTGISEYNQNITRFTYSNYHFDALQPSELEVELEYNSYSAGAFLDHESYLKLSLDYRHGFLFNKDKQFDVRIFAAGFLKNSQRESSSYNNLFVKGSISILSQGFTDYSYDEYFLDRQGYSKNAYRQIGFHGGGFKDAFGGAYNLGQSNDFAMAINLKSHLPIVSPKFPLKLFFDVAYASTKSFGNDPLEGVVYYSGGIMLEFSDGLFGVYLPLVGSSNITDIYSYEDRNLLSRITFSMDLHKWNPWEIADDYNF